ncbi:MAG: hypothetical protein H0X17_19540 [Deltaproteobacteria bacterium]|nr:hypothetical protein [Deltaproteobacteria bacterium]
MLTDADADPAALLTDPPYPSLLAGVVGAEQGGAAAVLQDFVSAIGVEHVERLRELTASEVGYGVEMAGSSYDDDLEPGDEPFEGVLITTSMRDDAVVLSRAAFARLVQALVNRARPRLTSAGALVEAGEGP